MQDSCVYVFANYGYRDSQHRKGNKRKKNGMYVQTEKVNSDWQLLSLNQFGFNLFMLQGKLYEIVIGMLGLKLFG